MVSALQKVNGVYVDGSHLKTLDSSAGYHLKTMIRAPMSGTATKRYSTRTLPENGHQNRLQLPTRADLAPRLRCLGK
jgi:hypothetical protein